MNPTTAPQGGIDPLNLPLNDFHLPSSVDWWPLAIGWWILIALLILAAMALYIWCRNRRLKKEALAYLADIKTAWLQQQNSQQAIKDLSALLRRINLVRYPQQAIAGLTGQQWLEHLDQPLKDKSFSQGVGKLLLDAPYQADITQLDLEPLFKLTETWIKTIKRSKP